MSTVKEGEGEGTSLAVLRRLDACEGDEDWEESMAGVILQVSLHSAPSTHSKRMKFPDLWRTFSAVAWCGKTNIIACATEICSCDPSDIQPAFWIPVHIINPERPTEHAVFNVTAGSPVDSIQSLEWSPLSCARALLISTFLGRVTVWMQPGQGAPNIAKAANTWSCEHQCEQEHALTTKWLGGFSPYRWPATSSKTSFEDKFFSYQSRGAARWPNILCFCSIFTSGSVQLQWCQRPHIQTGVSKWLQTAKGVLGAGPGGIMAADAIISETGALLVAGVPVGNPSTVMVWKVDPWRFNNQGSNPATVKLSTGIPLFNPAAYPGIVPIAAYLLSCQETLAELKASSGADSKLAMKEGKPSTMLGQQQSDVKDSEVVLLECSPVSNLSAYVSPDVTGGKPVLTGWCSGVVAVAFDPSRAGSALAVLVIEGHYLWPHIPDEAPMISGYRLQRWESSRQQVGIHPSLESAGGGYSSALHPMITVWKSVAENCIPVGAQTVKSTEHSKSDSNSCRFSDKERLSTVKPCPKIVFSGHGGELGVAVYGGEVHVFSGITSTHSDSFCLGVGKMTAPPSFSPTGCCLATVWHDSRRECSVLKVLCVHLSSPSGLQASSTAANLERSLADRFLWSLVSEVDWWDAVGFTQYAVEDNLATFHKLIAVLDADFHALPTVVHRQQYSPALDRIKCRLLEGVDTSDVRAVVLDMQARLLLEMLGKGIEASLINPATFISEPWLANGETLTQLVPDAMAVDPALAPYVQSYVDTILDLAAHFLTRLRRYVSFCRTLATHAVNNNSNFGVSSARVPSSNSSNTTTPSPVQGSQVAAGNTNGSASVQAWVQGALAKVNTNTEGAVSLPSATAASSGGVTPMQYSVSQAAFPGMPAVRLVGDCQFLHRLCQLLFFCLIFRRRHTPRPAGNAPKSIDSGSLIGKQSLSFSGKGPEESAGPNMVNRAASASSAVKSEEGQNAKSNFLGNKAADEHSRAARGNGNAGQGYTSDEVKYLFLVSADLCKRTSSLPHPLPKCQVSSPNVTIRLHYPDGQYSVVPEIVEASLSLHIQNLPRPRGADSAVLLMRELELHPPAEDWSKRNFFGGPWAGLFDPHSPVDERKNNTAYMEDLSEFSETGYEDCSVLRDLWPRKRRYAERDTAFGLRTAVSMGGFLGFMGSRRDVITASWKNTAHGAWHKCMRCGRQTGALASANPQTSSNETATPDIWWTGRWAYACPMCGGPWIKIV